MVSASPAVTDTGDAVYVAELDAVRSFTAAGEARWRTAIPPIDDLPGRVAGLAIDSRGRLVVSGPRSRLTWLDSATGAVVKAIDHAGDYFVTAPTLGKDDTVYVGGLSGMRAYSKDGDLLWTAFPSVEAFGVSPVAIAPDGDLVASAFSIDTPNPNSDHPSLFRVGADGSARWTQAFPQVNVGNSARTPVVGSDGTIWLARFVPHPLVDFKLFAYDANGAEAATKDFQKIIDAEVATTSDGDVVVSHLDGTTRLRRDATEVWRSGHGGWIAAALDGAGTTIVSDGGVRGLSNGEERWFVPLKSSIEHVSIAADGSLILVCRTPNELIAVR